MMMTAGGVENEDDFFFFFFKASGKTGKGRDKGRSGELEFLRPLANSVTLGTSALGVCVSWRWSPALSVLGPEGVRISLT